MVGENLGREDLRPGASSGEHGRRAQTQGTFLGSYAETSAGTQPISAIVASSKVGRWVERGRVEFEEFVSSELDPLRRLAGVLTGNRQDAHDVLSDALLVAVGKWELVAAADSSVAYVRKILLNTYLAQQRTRQRRRTEVTATGELPHGVAADASDRVELRDSLEQLLRELPRQQRAAVVLRYYLDLDDTAVAQQLDISVSTVRSSISRALATLRVSPLANRLEQT